MEFITILTFFYRIDFELLMLYSRSQQGIKKGSYLLPLCVSRYLSKSFLDHANSLNPGIGLPFGIQPLAI
jgi:hypothetical protein